MVLITLKHALKHHNLNRIINSTLNRWFCNNSTTFRDVSNPTSQDLEVLKNVFGHEEFKPAQWKVISSILNKEDNYVALPMGYGKSLCYQYPAVLKNGLSIVISPLISLMQDQVRSLEKNNIPACYFASTQMNRAEIIDKLFNAQYRLLYITPESILMPYGMNLLQSLMETNNVTLFAIDEAHCILHWGRDFRTSYQKLIKLRNNFPNIPIVALTATATTDEQHKIIDYLGMRNPNVTSFGHNHNNLYFTVKPMNEPFGDIVDTLFKNRRIDGEYGATIIYCLTIVNCKKIANLLKTMNIECEAYHSELDVRQRKTILDDFMNDRVRIIVATSAFGMGINKLDIRTIIHYGTPLNMENYFQEVGRAGRDGNRAQCVLYYSPSDFSVHRYLNVQNMKSAANILYNKDRTSVMKKYVINNQCRRDFILTHFGMSDSIVRCDSECCDNCTALTNNTVERSSDCSAEAELFLKAIESFQPRTFGIQTIIQLLMGVRSKKIFRLGLHNEFYGLGATKSRKWWKYLVLFLESERYINVHSQIVSNIMYSKVTVDARGKQWLIDRLRGENTPIILDLNRRESTDELICDIAN